MGSEMCIRDRRSMLALCAPAAITAFVVNPGSVFRSAAAGVPSVGTASPMPAGSSSPSLTRAATGHQVMTLRPFVLVSGVWKGGKGVKMVVLVWYGGFLFFGRKHVRHRATVELGRIAVYQVYDTAVRDCCVQQCTMWHT